MRELERVIDRFVVPLMCLLLSAGAVGLTVAAMMMVAMLVRVAVGCAGRNVPAGGAMMMSRCPYGGRRRGSADRRSDAAVGRAGGVRLARKCAVLLAGARD